MSLINPAQWSPEVWESYRAMLLGRFTDLVQEGETLGAHIIELDHDAERIEHVQQHISNLVTDLLAIGNSLDVAKTVLVGGRSIVGRIEVAQSMDEFEVPVLVDTDVDVPAGINALERFLASLEEDHRPETD